LTVYSQYIYILLEERVPHIIGAVSFNHVKVVDPSVDSGAMMFAAGR
jgi:hypothetical protein